MKINKQGKNDARTCRGRVEQENNAALGEMSKKISP